jgi:ComF family protein
MSLFEYIIAPLAPHHCLTCGAEGTLLCDPCSTSVKDTAMCCFKCGKPSAERLCALCQPDSPLAALRCASAYEGTAQQLVHCLKFGRAKAAAIPMARLLAARLPRDRQYFITHVPTATRRRRQRGYDQAALIARSLSRYTDLPYRPLLARSGQQRQLGKGRHARQLQLQEAFRYCGRLPHARYTVLLIDDVITTGASLEAAAQALHLAGIKHVEAAAFAAA